MTELDPSLKLYRVSVTVEFDMPVLARTIDEAKSVAESHWNDEVECAEPEFYATHIGHRSDAAGCDTDSLPWGPKDMKFEGGCENPQRTLDEYMDELGIE